MSYHRQFASRRPLLLKATSRSCAKCSGVRSFFSTRLALAHLRSRVRNEGTSTGRKNCDRQYLRSRRARVARKLERRAQPLLRCSDPPASGGGCLPGDRPPSDCGARTAGTAGHATRGREARGERNGATAKAQLVGQIFRFAIVTGRAKRGTLPLISRTPYDPPENRGIIERCRFRSYPPSCGSWNVTAASSRPNSH